MGRVMTTLLTAAVIAVLSLDASPAQPQGKPPGTMSGSFAVSGIGQSQGDLAAGGDVEQGTFLVTGTLTRQFVPAFWAGITARYSTEAWDFGSPAAFGGRSPWEHLQRPGVAVNLNLALSKSFVIGVSPGVEWPSEPGASPDDALIYGAVVSAFKVFGPDRVLGLGASVYQQFYSVKTSPFLIVNWKLAERWRIANALAAGPEGGAGVELRYTVDPAWELAAGGVYRGDRYRLDEQGPFPGAVGETSSIPLFARASRKLGAAAKLDLYAGAMTFGQLRVKDDDGRELAADDVDPAAALAATLSWKF